MVDRVGNQLGNYRLIRSLGVGGFAEVYLGEHVYLGTKAAIKVLHTQIAKDDLESFRKEARTIAELVHPNIVRILDFGVEGNTPFLVMEYAVNGTLRERHAKGSRVSPAIIATYLKDVAAALQYAHERKLIHRDIKPENMLVGQSGAILLSDFGIALIAQSSRLQSTQEVAGTIAYMAPEQLQGKPRFASDQYALGVVAYEWLSGERPFHGSFTEIASQHVLTPPPSLRAKIPSIPPAIEEVIFTALAKDPHQRFSNVQAFATAFQQACHSEAPTITATSHNPSSLSSSLPPSIVTKSASESQGILSTYHPQSIIRNPESLGSLTPPLQPLQFAPPPTSSTRERPQAPGTYSAEVRTVPKSKKAPNFGLLIGIGILLILVISGGSFALFFRSGSNNLTQNNGSQSGNNGSSTRTSTGGAVTKSTVKVALVTDVGGLNDRGFNQLAYTGYTKARNQYGFKEEVIQTQSQNDYVKNLILAAQEANLVVAVGFLMQTPLDQVAKQFPNVDFAIVDGCAVANATTGACETLPNVSALFFKEQQAGCIVGAIAGQMENDGKSKVPNLLGASAIGAVGGLAIPPVVRYIAGYKYCAKQVDPNVKVYVTYSNDFADTAKCKDAATSLINQHQVDIVFQVAGGCGIGALDAANGKNVYGIGVDTDQGYLYPSVITSAEKRVDTAVYTIIDLTERGQYTGNVPLFDLSNNGVGYGVPSSAVPQDAIQEAMTIQNQITSGTLVVPTAIPNPNTP
jgi:basic membrane protein A